MDFDLIFVIGVTLLAFALPALASAYADWRFPRLALLMIVIGGGSVAYAMQENPGAYTLRTIDDTIITVLGRYLN